MSTGSAFEKIIEQGERDVAKNIGKQDWVDNGDGTASSGAIEAWVDKSMYEAAPMEAVDGMILPKVYLLEMSADPLGNVAAMSEMYKGSVIRERSQITNEMRREHLQAMLDTHLTAPLENIKFHFMIEGIDRSFTHQLVRIRTGNFAQESLRFAVKSDLASEVTLPPSLAELPKHHPTRQMIDAHNGRTQELYNYLIANGVPAEDARAYLPHAVATRIHFMVDMRNLIHHAGNRLCTQAQFVWRDVFTQMREAVRTYTPDFSWVGESETAGFGEIQRTKLIKEWQNVNRWQFEALANTLWWKPACYQMGHCPFQASFDRGCTIRERVELNSLVGRKPGMWGITAKRYHPVTGGEITVEAIDDAEWMLDRTAAFLK